MNKASSRRKLAGSGLVLVAVLAGAGTAAALVAGSPSALAAPVVPAATTTTTAPGAGVGANSTMPMSSVLQKLVANGTITPAQATAVRNALLEDIRSWRSTGGAQMMQRGGMWASALSQLVTDATITQSQATAITKAMVARAEEFCGTRWADRTGYGMMGGATGSMMGWGTATTGSASSTPWGGSSMM